MGGDSYQVAVAVQQGNILATAFHPELTDDLRWHRYSHQFISGLQLRLCGGMIITHSNINSFFAGTFSVLLRSIASIVTITSSKHEGLRVRMLAMYELVIQQVQHCISRIWYCMSYLLLDNVLELIYA